MLKKFTITDKLLFISAFLSLIFSEILYFEGSKDQAIFIGLWVPSILAFEPFKTHPKNNKYVLNNYHFAALITVLFWTRFA
jgi:hypothetical protein